MEEMDDFPKGWGKDRLSDFQHQAFANELWSFANDPTIFKLLSDFDSLIVEYLLKSGPKQTEKANLGSLLLVNSHNHFRASARLCLSGQCLPVYPTARACLETAVYGWFLITYPDKVKFWGNKPVDKEELRHWNSIFKFSSIAKLIGKRDTDLEILLKSLHQKAIDFGAHPNGKALFSNMTPLPNDKSMHRVTYLHADGILLNHTFNYMFDISVSILALIKLSYKPLETDDEFRNKAKALVTRAVEQHDLFELLRNSSE